MATDLGKAYVQIMPSAKGIKSLIEKEMGGETLAAGKTAGIGFGKSLVKAAAGIVAAAGIGKLFQSSLMEGAELEQNLGGTEAVFGNHAKKIQKSAEDAYKNMGLSASNYMATANKMGSLFQGSGLEQQRALDLTSEAMQRAADVASVMGIDTTMAMESIAGAAKGNFTMMDNLGVAMNATTLEAYALEKGLNFKWNTASQAEKAELAMKMFMERTQQYSGNFAKESVETFSGSLGAMKAAWQNVMGNLSLGEDVKPALSALAKTVSDFLFRNLIPMVGNILKGLPSAIGTFISAATPSFMKAGQDLMNQLGVGFNNGVGEFASKMSANLQPLLNSFQTMAGQIPRLFSQVGAAVLPFVEVIQNALTQLDFSGFTDLAEAIIPALQAGFSSFAAVASPAIEGIVNSFVNLWNAAQPLISVIASGLTPAFQVMGSFLGGVLSGVLAGLQFAFDALAKVIEFLTPAVEWLVGQLKKFQPVLSVIAEKVGYVIGIFSNLGTASQGLGATVKSAWSNIGSAINTGKSLISGAVNVIKSGWNGLQAATNVLKGGFTSAWNAMKSAMSSAKSLITSAINAVKTGFNGFKNTVSNVGSAIKNIINGVANTIRGLANINISGAGAAIMNGFLGGLKSAWGRVQNFVGGIADWIRRNKGPISYDKKLLIPAGNAIMGSLLNGLENNYGEVKKSVSGIAGMIQNSMGTELNYAVSGSVSGVSLPQSQLESALAFNTMQTASLANREGVNGGYNPTLHIENFYNSTDSDAESLFKQFTWITKREGDRLDG
ncbi:hypothetical protein [Facklamia sp. 7083-14-GEN3]|uniref:phage tail protein n=1 Tax=Facklamia sp. 7083-14-GEN3 TaxID=2973478 RepID=UPI00215C1DE6|nr:hypothetical protein [Facklamia sp. 7083-14-GEN3]MCR8969270.1 hypothetical protein [Facklamia sp. 7083-14-GEN3]